MSRASLDGIKRINSNNIFSEYIDRHVIAFLENEGFIQNADNDGYYKNGFTANELKNCIPCYRYHINEYNNSGYDVFIYVAPNGIGIDVDLSCGGPSRTRYIPFAHYDTFAEAYNAAITELDCIGWD